MSHFTTLLAATQDRSGFSCGNTMLDLYIQRQARQDMKAKVAACFVLTEDGKEIKGYYTLSSSSIPHTQLPDPVRKKLPKYRDLPVTLLGRLAVSTKFKGKGQGKLLLVDALKRSHETSTSIGSMAVIVDPIDREAADFYAKYGFISFPGSGRMFLPMATISQLFE